ncbi:MAG: polynucleotide adenylyltransferase PcnB [Polyangiaceae bacterium]|nr:polynucleotide adenylyltransferase PcnB [Polyangiaceae bacterium]
MDARSTDDEQPSKKRRARPAFDEPAITVEDARPPASSPQGGGRRGRRSAPPIDEPATEITAIVEGPVHPRYAVSLDEDRIDPDVQKVVRRLVRHGYEAYLVGGCVRDLLLGGKPKDFDVATSARPEQVRELFRNSRVIGRRFRLVHVLFHGGKVIEVATFRRNPNDEVEEGDGTAASLRALGSSAEGGRSGTADPAQLLIRSDNVFGEAHEDASRRDFTINALFYDVEAGQILDWVGGLADIEKRVVNTIGEPHVRFREDPVRILRALKFAGRLDLGIQPEAYDAIVECRGALELAARPRVAEEVLKLLRSGGARRTMFLAWETGVLDVLLPELSALLYDSFQSSSPSSSGERFFRLLEFIDRRTVELGPRDDTVLWTLLLLEPLKEATEGARDRSVAAIEFLDPLLERLAIPRRFADGMRRILAVLPRILSGRAGRFARTELFDLALEVAEADLYARGMSLEPIRALRSTARPAEPSRSTNTGGRGHRPSMHARPRPTPRH